MSISHFTAQIWLGFLVVIALIALGYVVVQRNRRKHMLMFTNLALLEKVAPSRPSPFRHVAVALLLTGLVLLTVAAAGPTAIKKVPRNRATVMLVVDVSLSMEATDVAPNRIQVAQEAGKEFVDDLPEGVNIGFVTFAGTGSLLVSPTTDHDGVKAAIDNIKLAQRTATGEGILTALQAIDTLATVLGGASEPPPARIVLMSDGKQTVPSIDDINNPSHEFVAARLAKSKGIPISTISFGTEWGTVEIPDSEGELSRARVPVDDESLRKIADLSGGEFFKAASLTELTSVYDTLEEQIGYESIMGDASRPWLLLGLLVTASGVVAGLLYRQRLP
ncbi:VWA domain-containing protein [Nocardia sp. CNY236]|uniref:VWA domain-containing protein n=1 Tax=Nocardia sp. CNY236 TaxID=1169152 RepID=UPI0004252DB4|nr:VWA domain-containing protein [Nocardia sp. CNY236]